MSRKSEESEAEQYFRHKNKARRKRKVGRAAATQACCGIPCLLTAMAIAGLMWVLITTAIRFG